MLDNIKYIFIVLFLTSICSLTVQNTVLSHLKDGSTLKKQIYSNPVPAEEEEEHGAEKVSNEEDLYTECGLNFDPYFSFTKIVWLEHSARVSSSIISKHSPPPKA